MKSSLTLMAIATLLLLAMDPMLAADRHSSALVLKRSGLFGYEVTLAPDLTVTFVGKYNTRLLGAVQYKITEAEYSALQKRIFDAPELHGRMFGNPALSRVSESISFRTPERSIEIGSAGGEVPPPEYYELLWEIESVLRANQYACPADIQIGSRRVDACKLQRDEELERARRRER